MKNLENEVAELLIKKRWTISIAESCTGGLMSHRLTNIPGSSSYFLCGFVTYSNSAKIDILGVKIETINNHGAVSGQIAIEMARGARIMTRSTLALSITGIAGPGGATESKPVGLVYIGMSDLREDIYQKFNFLGNRLENKFQSTQNALKLLKEYLLSTEI